MGWNMFLSFADGRRVVGEVVRAEFDYRGLIKKTEICGDAET